ncbi:MAG: type secretion system protein [Moraxellaceae bacterium]|jgi:general secretion pathway protein M|nr:type secretion system protein [Moraxellaceae bacterium]
MKAVFAGLKQGWDEAIAPWRQRWLAMEPREQRALGIGGAAALLLFLVYGLWMPSHRAAANAEKQFDRNRALLLELQSRTAPSGGGAAAAGGSLLGLASSSAGASNLVLSRIEPEGDARVRVWLDKADFNRVAAWLATLSQQGIRLDEAQIERLAEGGVSARLALSR